MVSNTNQVKKQRTVRMRIFDESQIRCCGVVELQTRPDKIGATSRHAGLGAGPRAICRWRYENAELSSWCLRLFFYLVGHQIIGD